MEKEKKYLPENISTYEELKQVFEEFRINPEQTRFYVGADYTEPKAFVIYQDDFGDYVVYKMKGDGTRALRYKGPDEAHAVREYYQKFLDEVRKRPAFARKLLRPGTTRNNPDKTDENWFLILFFAAILFLFLSVMGLFPIWLGILCFLLVNPGIFVWYFLSRKKGKGKMIPSKTFSIIALLMMLTFGSFGMIYQRYQHRHDGYYVTPHGTYYTQGHDVYYFDDDWVYYGNYDTFYDTYEEDYTYYEDYNENEDYDDFKESSYYDDWKSSSSDSDSGWSSSDSWDSWDSGGSDWDSDW